MARTSGPEKGAPVVSSDSAEQSFAAAQRSTTIEARIFQELIFNQIPDLIFVKDEDFRIVWANKHFLGVYPQDMRASVIGHTTIEQYNEEERNAFLEQDRIAFEQGFAETEESLEFPDGARRTLLTRKIRIEDSDGNRFILAIGRDITELANARKERIASLALLNSVFETVSGAIIGLDADKQVVMINNAGRHMLGEDTAEAPFDWPAEIGFLDPEDMHPLETSRDPIARALIGQEIGGEVHLMTRKLSGEARYIRVTSRMVHNQSSPLHSVIVLDDVSEAERNRQQIERQSRLDALGQLTGGIAHDFNNLLNTMQFAIELIRRDNLSKRAQRSATAALNSIKRGAELTGRMLAFAKKQPERASARPMTETFGELKELVAPSIEASVTVEFGDLEEDLLAFCDQGQLQNAVLNLILNSRDAIMETGQGNSIKIEARAIDFLPTSISASSEQTLPSETEGRFSQGQSDIARADGHAQRYIEISVSDNGPGMSKAVAARALDPFFTTKSVNSGTGLGLSMVYGFVQQSDGEVRIYSEQGHGTTVRMFLPRGDKSTGLEEPFALEPLPNGKGETILIAEDEAFLRDQLGELLKALNYDILEASSGRDAVAMLKAGALPDLILTDVVMPGGIGGFELARLAREIIPNVPIIYMSGYTGFADEEMGAVIAPLLPKPSSPSIISGQLRAALGDTDG